MCGTQTQVNGTNRLNQTHTTSFMQSFLKSESDLQD